MWNMKSAKKSIQQLVPNFETKQLALERRDKLIRALHDGRGRAKGLTEQWRPFIGVYPEKIELIVTQAQEEDRKAIALARRLKRCATSRPCNLSICPLCVRKIRKRLIIEAVACVDQLGLLPELPITEFGPIAVTTRQHYEHGTVGQIDLGEIRRYIRAQHEQAGFPLAFAGIKLLFNDGRQGNGDPGPSWYVQINGVVVGWTADSVETTVRRLYPSDTLLAIPSTFRERSNLAEALDFAVKPEFAQRPGLKKAQLNEVASWLSLYKPRLRYVLTGCHFNGCRLELSSGAQSRIKELASTRYSLGGDRSSDRGPGNISVTG
jgi:hypothetical protein